MEVVEAGHPFGGSLSKSFSVGSVAVLLRCAVLSPAVIPAWPEPRIKSLSVGSSPGFSGVRAAT